MTAGEIESARREIESTDDLLARAMKLSGLLTTLFQAHGVKLVVVGGSAVEFYTEGGYMSGDIDFCRASLAAASPRLVRDILSPLGGRCVGRNWVVCGLFVDILGIVESETSKDWRELETPYGRVRLLPPELALVERIFYAIDSSECEPSARQMMVAALNDPEFDWDEAARLAALPSFGITAEFDKARREALECAR